MLKSEFLVIAQANLLLHLLLRLLLLRQLRRPPPPPPQHRVLEQLQLLQRRRRQVYRLHHLRLLQAVLLKTMLVDQTILAPMACAAVSGAIVVLQKDTVESAAKVIVMDSLRHHLVQAHPLQALLQAILRHLLLGLTIMPNTEKIVASLHTLGTGKLVPLMSKLMHIRTL